MAKRKTIKVDDFRIKVNGMLRESTCDASIRKGMMAVLETILHDTGNYKGFRYLNQNEVPKGALAGIIWGANETSATSPNVSPHDFPDETRVEYFSA